VKLFSSKTKEQKFWNWIDKNVEHIVNIESGDDPYFTKATNESNKYNPELVFEICGNEIVISADGDKDYFDDVIELCNAAPSNNRYTVTAFRQANGFVPIEYGDFMVKPEDVMFKYDVRDGVFDLDIFHRDYSEETKIEIGSAIFLILDHGIGEYNVEMRIGSIVFKKFSDQEGLKPITELKTLIDLKTN